MSDKKPTREEEFRAFYRECCVALVSSGMVITTEQDAEKIVRGVRLMFDALPESTEEA